MRRSTALLCACVALALNLRCAAGSPLDAGADGGPDRPDARSIFLDAQPEGGTRDGGETADASAPASDAGGDSATPAFDASADGGGDAGPDGGPSVTCPALDPGRTISLDGTNDFDEFLSEARLSLGGSVGADDALAVTWDQDYLYGALRAPVFADTARPLHVYLEVRETLSTAAPAAGKEYDGLTAQLPFTATHLVAVRRVSDLGGAGAYNAVYTPGGGWTSVGAPLSAGAEVFTEGTGLIAFRVPWTALGCVDTIRLSAHVVNGTIAGNEWKDFAPMTAMPWASLGGGYYELDLTGAPAVSGWTLR